MKKMVGVDIGATEVRAVEVAGVDSNSLAIVTRLGVAPMPEGAIVGGRIKNPQAVATAMVRALKRAGLPSYGFVMNISSPDVAMTTMTLPSAVRRDEREGAIRALGRPLSANLPLDDSVLASQLLTSAETADGFEVHTVAVAAALRSEVEMIQTVCKMARCTPRAIDFGGVALIRALTRANATSNEVATVVDIGATKTSVATRVGPHVRSLRVTAGGGSELTRALLSANGGDVDIAEQAKMSMKLPTSTRQVSTAYTGDDDYQAERDPSMQSLSSASDVLVDTIAQSIELDAANHGTYTQGVFLTGGTALLRGFKERLQQRVGVPVVVGRPWADLERSKRNVEFFADGKPDPRVLFRLSTAIGLALWKEPM
jgi:type IV pilus assembly protein PilM